MALTFALWIVLISIAIGNGRQHRYTGGLAKKPPLTLQIPSSGRWHVAVDMQGLRGSTKVSVRMLQGALPAIQDRPLAIIFSNSTSD